MIKSNYLLFLFLALVLLASKVAFFVLEPLQLRSVWAVADFVIAIGLLVLATHAFFKTSHQQIGGSITSHSAKNILLLVAASVVMLGMSFMQNVQKQALDWDAIALYDARAVFLKSGIAFSQMPQLSQYDYKNGYYYLLYPPFTSLMHYAWHQLSIPLPVNVFYTLCLIALWASLFFLSQPRLGTEWSLFVSFLVVSQRTLFTTSLIAYTNLPYTLCLTIGLFSLYNYLIDDKKWLLYFGAFFLAHSQWVRFLEPSWLPIVIAFSLALIKKKGVKPSLTTLLTVAIPCMLGYLSWRYFVQDISNREVIFNTSLPFLLEPFLGAFTGSLLLMAWAYIKMWGSELVIYGGAILTLFVNSKYNQLAEFFLLGVLFLVFSMYFAGLYFISFQFDWWPEMSGSLLRSSTFLLPPAVYLIVRTIKKIPKQ